MVANGITLHQAISAALAAIGLWLVRPAKRPQGAG
jgi:hypothetical protein